MMALHQAPKKLILIRHAHRDNSNRAVDNGLSEKGQRQAENLTAFVKARARDEGWPPETLCVLSSPKLRCVETVTGIAKVFKKNVEIEELLGEQSFTEGRRGMQVRIEKFTAKWTQGSTFATTIACSHGDLLPQLSSHLVGVPLEFKKSAYAEFEYLHGVVSLRWFLPNCKLFA